MKMLDSESLKNVCFIGEPLVSFGIEKRECIVSYVSYPHNGVHQIFHRSNFNQEHLLPDWYEHIKNACAIAKLVDEEKYNQLIEDLKKFNCSYELSFIQKI